jgi:hypothetical protein
MRRALVVCAAPHPHAEEFYRSLIGRHDGLLIAADGGAGLCLANDRIPDLLVGDLDSIPSDILKRTRSAGTKVAQAPVDKDETDLDLALQGASDLGASTGTHHCGVVSTAGSHTGGDRECLRLHGTRHRSDRSGNVGMCPRFTGTQLGDVVRSGLLVLAVHSGYRGRGLVRRRSLHARGRDAAAALRARLEQRSARRPCRSASREGQVSGRLTRC